MYGAVGGLSLTFVALALAGRRRRWEWQPCPPPPLSPASPETVPPPKPVLPKAWNGITLNLHGTCKAGQDFTADATVLANGVPVLGVVFFFLINGRHPKPPPFPNAALSH